jgi:hypothetical protein
MEDDVWIRSQRHKPIAQATRLVGDLMGTTVWGLLQI